jgi:hypothetical protein
VTVAAQYFNGFTGTPTIDKSNGTAGSSTTANPGTSATTTVANELVVVGAGHAGTASAFSLGSGYTNLTTVNQANAAVGQESKVISSTGTQTGTMTIAASRAWGAILATFYDLPLNVAPTIALDTADATDFGTVTTPTLEFTGSDTDSDMLLYEIQIDDDIGFGSPTLDKTSGTDEGFL